MLYMRIVIYTKFIYILKNVHVKFKYMSKNDKIPEPTMALSTTKLDGFTSVQEMMKWAETIIESGLLPEDISEPEQVITIVQHGKELGLSPHVAINNLHVISGRPTISAAMLGALLKRAGIEWTIEKDYEKVTVDDITDRVTTYKFFWMSKVTKTVIEVTHTVSWGQLEVAGYTSKSNYKKYPKEMMRARCLSSGVRAYFPEVLMGMYTDMEMSDVHNETVVLDVNELGDVSMIHTDK